MDLFVGNLNKDLVTEEKLMGLFSDYGTVVRVSLIMDRELHMPKGFAFIEMPNDTEAQVAIGALDGKGFLGRMLRVSVAHPRPERPFRG